MSQYATRAELAQILSAQALTGVSTADQDAALVRASGDIDSYLGSKYTLPLISWGDDLRRKCMDIAAYDILSKRPINSQETTEWNTRVRYEDAINWLKEVAKPGSGVTPVNVVDSTPAVSGSGARVHTSEPRGL